MIKNTFILCLVSCFASFSAFPQSSNWKWQNPLPQGNPLHCVFFVDTTTGWSVGRSGMILKSKNGGVDWELQSASTLVTLNAVQFVNPNLGWVVGDSGLILKTTNGGQRWSKQNSGVASVLSQVVFLDASTGWIIGEAGVCLKTINGGSNWIPVNLGSTANLLNVFFLNPLRGWIVGGSTIKKTTDGGQTWIEQAGSFGGFINPFYIQFKDTLNGWAVADEGKMIRTSDGGNTWSSITIPETFTRSAYFIDSVTGWMTGQGGVVYKTTNGGTNWTTRNYDETNPGLISVHFPTRTYGIAVGENGAVFLSTNGGNSWKRVKKNHSKKLNSIRMITVQRGFAVGDEGAMLKTTNAGLSWGQQPTLTNQVLRKIRFYNDTIGWVVGDGGVIYKTIDGGLSWFSQNSGVPNMLYSICTGPTAQTAWVCGSGGILLKTNDGGSTWQSLQSPVVVDLLDIFFINDQIGWTVGYNGVICKTTNGGTSWDFQLNPDAPFNHTVHFVNPLIGYIGGYGGVMLKTVNGGTTWQVQNTGTTYFIRSLRFLNPQVGWAVGYGGLLLSTTNGGALWKQVPTRCSDELFDLEIKDATNIWLVGDNGAILANNKVTRADLITASVTGKLFEKAGQNCDLSPVPVAGRLIKTTPGPYYGYSEANGNYDLRIPLGTSPVAYSVQPVEMADPAFQITTVCPPSGQVTVQVDTMSDTLAGNHFGMEVTSCHHLKVELSSNRRRRCSLNTTIVSYVNQGLLEAPDAYILVGFSQWVRPITASAPFVAVHDSLWRFDLGMVAAGQSGAIILTDSVVCGNDEIRGTSQCTQATIFPAPDCPPPSAWSGAEVTVSGRCENGMGMLIIYNRTVFSMTDSVGYSLYFDSLLVWQKRVMLAAGDSLALLINPGSFGIHLVVNQVQNHPTDRFVTATLESCGSGEGEGLVNRFPVDVKPNTKTQCLPIIDSYDPNDKKVFPIGFTEDHVVEPGSRLEYIIRFQNTGTDTAYTVYVVDTLDSNLDVESFEMGTSSHSYRLTMQTNQRGKTFLRWQYNRIMLPDSGVNEPASNGFIQFWIAPKAGLLMGTKVRNQAEIYFDYNLPVITNQTLTTFDNRAFTNPGLSDSVHVVVPTETRKSLKQLGLEVYPNPFTYSLHLKSTMEKLVRISVRDVLGKEWLSTRFTGSKELELGHLPSGIYLLHFPELNRVLKVVKE